MAEAGPVVRGRTLGAVRGLFQLQMVKDKKGLGAEGRGASVLCTGHNGASVPTGQRVAPGTHEGMRRTARLSAKASNAQWRFERAWQHADAQLASPTAVALGTP